MMMLPLMTMMNGRPIVQDGQSLGHSGRDARWGERRRQRSLIIHGCHSSGHVNWRVIGVAGDGSGRWRVRRDLIRRWRDLREHRIPRQGRRRDLSLLVQLELIHRRSKVGRHGVRGLGRAGRWGLVETVKIELRSDRRTWR